jgi:hypothetical protein
VPGKLDLRRWVPAQSIPNIAESSVLGFLYLADFHKR